jgi:hypothetical protein
MKEKSRQNSRYNIIKASIGIALLGLFFLSGLWEEPLRFWIKTITIGLLIFLTLVTDIAVEGYRRKDVLQRWFFTALLFNMYANYIGHWWIQIIAVLLFIPGIYWIYLNWKEHY